MQAETLTNGEGRRGECKQEAAKEKSVHCRGLSLAVTHTSHIQVRMLRLITLLRFQLSHDIESHDFIKAMM